MTPELWERGIRVSSANDALGQGVAETALGFTITSLKNMWALSSHTRAGEWTKGRDRVREMYGITIGVIGAGKSGQHYIRLLSGFDVNVIVFDPMMTPARAAQLNVTLTDLDDLMSRSDVVSIHAPALPSTYRMINRERLARMKDDAILINTARGSIIDEVALIEELRTGRIFACLDVAEIEPPAPDHPFRSLPNCILTPHIAGAVGNGLWRLGAFAVDELMRFLDGKPMQGEVVCTSLDVIA